MVQEWYDVRLSSTTGDAAERVRVSIESVKYKVKKKNPAVAALTLVSDVLLALDRNNVDEVLKNEKRTVSKIKLLIPKLQPSELNVVSKVPSSSEKRTEKATCRSLK